MEYIARISKGKDSLKMLDVIVSRGLPLDRITTTDIWATDTIRGEHPKMVEFESFIDEYIWTKYRIEVEHLCAMKKRRKGYIRKDVLPCAQAEGRKEGRKEGAILGFPMLRGTWCQTALKTRVRTPPAGFSCTNRELVQKAQNRLYTASRSLSTEPEVGAPNSKRVFRQPHHKGQERYCGIHRHSRRRAEAIRAA